MLPRIFRFISVILVVTSVGFIQPHILCINNETSRNQVCAMDGDNEFSSVKADDYYIEELIANYETLIIEAINQNKFSLVSDLLIKGSSIYKAQKKLVSDLSARKIKEKLITFSIEDIQYVDDYTTKVFVFEKVGIKYPQKKTFIIKEYYWIYTIKNINGSIGLSNIETWIKK